MNDYTAIDVSYLRPSRSIETILLENNKEKRILYVYNYDGVHFRIFNFIKDILHFFNDEFDPEISFETEVELDYYLAHLDLKNIYKSSATIE